MLLIKVISRMKPPISIEGFSKLYAQMKARSTDRFVENFIDGLKGLAVEFAQREYGDRPNSDKNATVNVIRGDLSVHAKVIEGETAKPKQILKKAID